MLGKEKVKPLMKLPLFPAVLHRALPLPGRLEEFLLPTLAHCWIQ